MTRTEEIEFLKAELAQSYEDSQAMIADLERRLARALADQALLDLPRGLDRLVDD